MRYKYGAVGQESYRQIPENLLNRRSFPIWALGNNAAAWCPACKIIFPVNTFNTSPFTCPNCGEFNVVTIPSGTGTPIQEVNEV